MSRYFVLSILFVILLSCQKEDTPSTAPLVNWKERSIELEQNDSSLTHGKSYLSVYPEIYSITENKTLQLTVTVSLRNMNEADSVFILSSKYYNTHGDLIHNYHKSPVYVLPMETVEIVLDKDDTSGGTGANFIFDWSIKKGSTPPLFESVMILTSGQQGISFTTTGIELK